MTPSHKGHKCLNSDGRVYISKDVLFNEYRFPYPHLFQYTTSAVHNTPPTFPSSILVISSTNHTNPPTVFPSASPAGHSSSTSADPPSSPSTSQTSSPIDSVPVTSIPDVFLSIPKAAPPEPSNTHPTLTSSKTRNLKPRLFLAHVEPKTVKQALSHPQWLAAMQAEYKALLANNTWTLVPLPPHRKAIGCKWVFRVKENPDGSINKYKARLVAKGFHQQPRTDFSETFSPVIMATTIRIILILALTYKWDIQQIDVNNAFLNGNLQEEVYMMQPQGFESFDKAMVCKLNKALYGLKQAPRAWYEWLTQALLLFGFKASKCDPSLFVYNHNGITLYALVYVDDILITGSSSKLVADLISKLNSNFALKHLGKPDYFLEIEVKYLDNGSIILTQTKYICDLLHKATMADCNSISTPMVHVCKLSRHGTDSLPDASLFRYIVGALQYVTLTRPELSYCQ